MGGGEKIRPVFLLGGYDLEMTTIRDLLLVHGYRVEDRRLEWGARLSAYEDILNNTDTFAGIELVEDIPLPDHYIAIDHHNLNSGKPSSLEQVANLTGVSLNRYQQLVAANDCRHIPGMLAMGASHEEIKRIRKADRLAQGVTEHDEELAQYQIDRDFRFKHDIGVIQTTLKKFSPISDRLRLSKLIIYNNTTVSYYGKSASLLAEKAFKAEYKANQAYFGGGLDGFFEIQIDDTKFNTTKEVVDIIIEHLHNKQPISVHSFLFPFKWGIKDSGGKINSVNSKFSKTKLDIFEVALLGSEWVRRNDYDINASHLNYNEYTYYHDFVREIIFDRKSNVSEDLDVMRYYQFSRLSEGAYYEIDAAPFRPKPYRLKLTGLNLHIYKTGIGILSFDLENYELGSTKEDILSINEYGRRIYPQFVGEGFDLLAVKNTFLASSIAVSFDGIEEFKEDFSAFGPEKHEEYLNPENSFIPPVYINALFKKCVFGECNAQRGDIVLKHLTDDRMFTLCWYGNNELADTLKEPTRNGYNFQINDWWYAYLFGDKQYPSVANACMKKEQIAQHTYSRWAEYGTLFGITRDTFVAVSCDVPTLNRFFAPIIRDHISSIYYQMVTLGLAQRATILKFSADVSDLADIKHLENDEQLIRRVQTLYANYIEFINKVFFREVTSQIQGIELYQQMQKLLNIEKEVNDLDKEISELHSYISLLQDKQRNEQSNKLNKMAALFLPASFIASVLGIGFIGENSSFSWFGMPERNVINSLILIFSGGILGFFAVLLWIRIHEVKVRVKALWKKNKKNKRKSYV